MPKTKVRQNSTPNHVKKKSLRKLGIEDFNLIKNI